MCQIMIQKYWGNVHINNIIWKGFEKMEKDLIIDSYDKTLLMHCINTYMEKIEFVLKNARYYGISDFIFEDFKRDLIRLKELQIRIFSIDIKDVNL